MPGSETLSFDHLCDFTGLCGLKSSCDSGPSGGSSLYELDGAGCTSDKSLFEVGVRVVVDKSGVEKLFVKTIKSLSVVCLEIGSLDVLEWEPESRLVDLGVGSSESVDSISYLLCKDGEYIPIVFCNCKFSGEC